MDYKKMYNKMELELEEMFTKGNMTPEKVSVIDDITTAMRNFKKMEYWDSADGERERHYNREKHEGKHKETHVVVSDGHKEDAKVPYSERDEMYGFCDDLAEYRNAKEHYRKCAEMGDIAASHTWKEVALGNLRSALAQLDMGLQAMISHTDTEEERVAIKDIVMKMKDRLI